MKEINLKDLKINVYRLSAQGFGQLRTGVAILHLPSMTRVSSIEGRSEYQNRQLAMEKLITALEELDKIIPEQKTGNLPETSYSRFKAMAQGQVDHEIDVICANTSDYGKLMCICTEDAVYITREQAKKFFGFKD